MDVSDEGFWIMLFLLSRFLLFGGAVAGYIAGASTRTLQIDGLSLLFVSAMDVRPWTCLV